MVNITYFIILKFSFYIGFSQILQCLCSITFSMFKKNTLSKFCWNFYRLRPIPIGIQLGIIKTVFSQPVILLTMDLFHNFYSKLSSLLRFYYLLKTLSSKQIFMFLSYVLTNPSSLLKANNSTQLLSVLTIFLRLRWNISLQTFSTRRLLV